MNNELKDDIRKAFEKEFHGLALHVYGFENGRYLPLSRKHNSTATTVNSMYRGFRSAYKSATQKAQAEIEELREKLDIDNTNKLYYKDILGSSQRTTQASLEVTGTCIRKMCEMELRIRELEEMLQEETDNTDKLGIELDSAIDMRDKFGRDIDELEQQIKGKNNE